MESTLSFENRLVAFLHDTFPDSLEIPLDELQQVIQRLLAKAQGYGFADEAPTAIYVTTAYMLGENFDTEFPAATEILTNLHISAEKKADWLEDWTRRLFASLEEDQNEQPGESAAFASETSMADYLTMEAEAQPYRELAEWVVRQLMVGDYTVALAQFSPNFLQQLGLPTVKQVFAEQMLPYFTDCTILGKSVTVTRTTNAFGSTGFAFYMAALTAEEDEKPFVIYIVEENGRLVLANLLPNQTYASMH